MDEQAIYMQHDEAYSAAETRRALRELADAYPELIRVRDGVASEPTTNLLTRPPDSPSGGFAHDNQQPTTEICWECAGSGVDPGSLNEPEPCAVCLGAGELAPGELYIAYDHANQAWVKDGVYVTCGHAAPNCGCFGKLHAGEPRRAA